MQVTVAPVVRRTIPLQREAIGLVEAQASVTVRSQVSGILRRVHFREGQEISRHKLLFTLDSRPFELALKQAEANLARDQAQVRQAQSEAQRSTRLLQEGVVSREQTERLRSSAEGLASGLQASRSAVENARLQLSYCRIRSPLSGRTGDLLVHEGNLVKANDDRLVTIHQMSPISVVFSVPEQELPDIRRRMARSRLSIVASAIGANSPLATGELDFVDNTVDTATGSIRLKASFPNTDRALWPGQYINVVLILGQRADATLVSSRAVQIGQKGPYVFVVRKDLTAELRPLTLGESTPDGEQTVVTRGLRPGERVVLDGQLKLLPGATVAIKAKAARRL